MFWNKKSEKEEKLSGPREIPGLVQSYLVGEKKLDPDLVKLLKAVVRRGGNGDTSSHIRIFDESEGFARKILVKDYTSLDECLDLIIYEGWYDEGLKQVKLEEKHQVALNTPIFSQDEIQKQIESLSEPGSTVFFYRARGSSHGGPLGMGAAVVEINPDYPGKKQKKYIIYGTDVIDMQPVGKGGKMFDSDKPKDIARWIKDGHHKRLYS
jgi:hypothetical protein